MSEKRIFNFNVKVGRNTKKNMTYLYTKSSKDNMVFVKLIKDNKRYDLEIPNNVNELEVSCLSYKYNFFDNENSDFGKTIELVLFNVENVLFIKNKETNNKKTNKK